MRYSSSYAKSNQLPSGAFRPYYNRVWSGIFGIHLHSIHFEQKSDFVHRDDDCKKSFHASLLGNSSINRTSGLASCIQMSAYLPRMRIQIISFHLSARSARADDKSCRVARLSRWNRLLALLCYFEMRTRVAICKRNC